MELKNIQDIFKSNRFFIPIYQRGYAWENDQIHDFITDIKDSFDIDEHYTGQIIVASKKQELIGTVSYNVYEVVDGQQRLTTISIYILCIYNRMKQLGFDTDRILDNVIYKNIPILKLNDDSNQFYEDIILKSNVSDTIFDNKSQRNLFAAKKLITNHLQAYKSEKKLLEEYQSLMSKFRVNFSVLTSQLEAGLVFETMNDRGIALNQLDKVKNYLIYLCSRLKDKKLANVVNENYGAIFRELMKIEEPNNKLNTGTQKIEDDFLSCSYFLFYGKSFKDSVHHHIKTELLPKKEVIKKTRQTEIPFDNSLAGQQKTIDGLARFLGRSSFIYSSIFNCSFKTDIINEYLKRISFLDGTEKHSRLLLSLFITKKEENISSILELIEILVFRCKKQVSTNDLALDIKKFPNEYTVKKIRDELKVLINRACSDRSFEEMLKSNDFYTENKAARKIQYFFYEYEKFVSEEKNINHIMPSFDDFYKREYNKLEIEHIDPQIPSGRRPLECVNQLGNLTATFNNRGMGRVEFSDKKKFYMRSNLNVEKLLVSYDKWDEKEITKRTLELIKFAKKRWSYK